MQIIGARTLSKKKFDGLAIAHPYLDLLGFITPDFQAFIWGDKGSGKSTFALGLAYALLDFAKMENGRVLYVSSEEGPSLTLSSRAERLGAQDDDDLKMADFSTIKALRDAVLRHDIQFVVIDSVTVVNPQTREARELFAWLKSEGVGVALVAHANKKGSHKGDNSLAHNCDVVVHCEKEWDEDGVEMAHYATTTKNRFRPLARIRIPMTGEQIMRPNPDCTSPQSAQCKAIFASLDEDGQKQAGGDGGSSSKGSGSKKKSGGKKKGSSKGGKKKSGGSKKKSSSGSSSSSSGGGGKSAGAKKFDSTLSGLTDGLSKLLG